MSPCGGYFGQNSVVSESSDDFRCYLLGISSRKASHFTHTTSSRLPALITPSQHCNVSSRCKVHGEVNDNGTTDRGRAEASTTIRSLYSNKDNNSILNAERGKRKGVWMLRIGSARGDGCANARIRGKTRAKVKRRSEEWGEGCANANRGKRRRECLGVSGRMKNTRDVSISDEQTRLFLHKQTFFKFINFFINLAVFLTSFVINFFINLAFLST